MRRRHLLQLSALSVVGGLGLPDARLHAQDDAPPFEQIADVAYGEIVTQGEPAPLLLDVYRPTDGEGTWPAVVVIHGGGFQFGSRADLSQHAQELAAAGYVAVAIEYRLTTPEDPGNLWPVHLDDAQRAVRWLRAHADDYGVDPERVASYGHSAGGTLAELLGVRDTRDEVAADDDPELAGISSRVQCVVSLAGVSDFTLPAMAEQYPILFGETIEEDPGPYEDASAVSFVDDGSAPMLLVHGDEDIDVPVEHSRLLAAALEAAGVEVELVEIPGGTHETTFDWAVVGESVLPFLDRQLHAVSAGTATAG